MTWRLEHGFPYATKQIRCETLRAHRSRPASLTRILVLSFHGIGEPPVGVPIDERPFWMAERSFVSFIANASSRAKTLDVGLHATFDDGNRSDLEIAAPVLAKYGVSGSFFPCTARLRQSGYLSEEDVRQLFKMGFEIGGHGIDHVPWTPLDSARLSREITVSKRILEDFLVTKIQTVAIPFGSYNRRVLRRLKAAGYTKVYTSDRGFAYPEQWLTRRWCYNSEELFDLDYLVRRSSSARHRIFVAMKGMLKALR